MGTGRRIRWFLILLAAVAVAFAEDDEEKKEAPAEWEDELFRFEPVRFESGKAEQQIELTIERWGTVEGPQKFTLHVETKPAFIEEATWHPGAEVEFGPKDDTKTVHLRLKLAGTGSGEDELILVVRAADEEISPRERRIALPFAFGRAKPKGAAYVIKHDAPEKIKAEELLDHVDWKATPVYCCDRIAVFFTPPVDIEAEKVVFHWSIRLKPDEEEEETEEGKEEETKKEEDKDEENFWAKEEREGRKRTHSGCWNPGDWFHNDTMGRFKEGEAPAAFGIEVVPFGRPRQGRFYPGRYIITSAGEKESDNSLFGEKGAVVGEPEDVAEFDVADLPDLQFATFKADPGMTQDLSGLKSIVDGVARFSAVSAGGRKVRFEGHADYLRVGQSVDEDDPDKGRTIFERSVEIIFPEVLKLSESEMGKLECTFDRGEEAGGGISFSLDFVGTLHRIVPVAEGKLDSSLVLDEEPPIAICYVTKDRNEEDGQVSSPFSGMSIRNLPDVIHGNGPRPYTVSFTKSDTYGRPDRPLGPHLRDDATKFVLPVRFSFVTDTNKPQAYDQFGFAIYKVRKP